MSDKGKNSTIVSNRKARHEYQFLEEVEAGIVLTGTEVKSLRNGKASLQEAYCFIDENEEAWVTGMNIAQYEQGNIFNHEPQRPRKLLLKKKTIRRLKQKLEQQGLTLVPVRLFFNERNYAKLAMVLAKGKKVYDKREDLKEKDTRRALERAMERY